MKINNVYENQNVKISESKGIFSILEYEKDLSLLNSSGVIQSYFMTQTEVKRRQPVAKLDGSVGLILNSHMMQFTAGKINCTTNVKGLGNLVGKMISAAVTKNSVIKPLYTGVGEVFIEPSHGYYLLIDISDHNDIVLSDRLFVACEDTVKMNVVPVRSISGATLGDDGIFHLCLSGEGVALLESPVSMHDLIRVDLQNEELKVEGHHVLMWSNSINYTIERSSKTLLGSTITGQGLLHVYRGTGSVWMSSMSSEVVERFRHLSPAQVQAIRK